MGDNISKNMTTTTERQCWRVQKWSRSDEVEKLFLEGQQDLPALSLPKVKGPATANFPISTCLFYPPDEVVFLQYFQNVTPLCMFCLKLFSSSTFWEGEGLRCGLTKWFVPFEPLLPNKSVLQLTQGYWCSAVTLWSLMLNLCLAATTLTRHKHKLFCLAGQV